jgi:DNA-binding CsgD family transcriptional regulator
MPSTARARDRVRPLALAPRTPVVLVVEDDPLVRCRRPREREVAVLVASGRTNRQVAEALVLAEGTAANHVRRIPLRLGLDSRTRLALWGAADPGRRLAVGLG